MGFKNIDDWKKFTKTLEFPNNIPKAPHFVYEKKGEWISFGHWLGTNRVATNNIKFLDYSKAIKIVHKLKISTNTEWANYCKSGKLPTNIPKAPAQVYKNNGWSSWGEWLGTKRIATKDIAYYNFMEVKKILEANAVKNRMSYFKFIKANNYKLSFPSAPERTYKKHWKGWADFLGKE